MSPNGQAPGRKISTRDNIYTALLAVSVAMVLLSAIFVVYKCYAQYETIFKIP
jgi:hypothetical protein